MPSLRESHAFTGADNRGSLEGKLASGESFGTAFLIDSLAKGREFESFGDALRVRSQTGIDSIGQEQGRLNRGAASTVQQKFKTPGGGSFAKNLEQTIRRGKARQGINNRGDASIRNQQLKDRLMMAKSSVVRRGNLQQTSANAAQLRAGGEAATRSANSQVSQAYAGAAGGIVGGAVRGFGENLFNSSGEISVAMDQGTAGSDFMNGSFESGFDIDGVGQGNNGGVMYS